MIEPRAQAYRLVDPITGAVGYNMWQSSAPSEDTNVMQMRISQYDSFSGWATDILPAAEVQALVKKLNAAAAGAFEETPHTKLVDRVYRRIKDGDTSTVDGHSVIDDMREMLRDIEGRRIRPALPGWGR